MVIVYENHILARKIGKILVYTGDLVKCWLLFVSPPHLLRTDYYNIIMIIVIIIININILWVFIS